MIIFKKLTADAYADLQPYLKKSAYRLCEYNFNNLLMWSFSEAYYYYKEADFALVISNGDAPYALMPLCEAQHYLKAYTFLKTYYEQYNQKVKFSYVNDAFQQFFAREFGQKVSVAANRDYYDYLYLAKEQRELRGKKFDKIRNHINRFSKKYKKAYRYAELQPQDFVAVHDLLHRWSVQRGAVESEQLNLYNEDLGINELLAHYADLQYKIGGIWIQNELIAFTIGSYLLPNTVQISVEKGDIRYRGVYQLLQNEFLKKTFPDAIYVNREDDAGIENLRANKLSSKPIELIAKYSITFSE